MFLLYGDVSSLNVLHNAGEYDSVPVEEPNIMIMAPQHTAKYEVTVLVLGKQERPALIETC